MQMKEEEKDKEEGKRTHFIMLGLDGWMPERVKRVHKQSVQSAL